MVTQWSMFLNMPELERYPTWAYQQASAVNDLNHKIQAIPDLFRGSYKRKRKDKTQQSCIDLVQQGQQSEHSTGGLTDIPLAACNSKKWTNKLEAAGSSNKQAKSVVELAEDKQSKTSSGEAGLFLPQTDSDDQ